MFILFLSYFITTVRKRKLTYLFFLLYQFTLGLYKQLQQIRVQIPSPPLHFISFLFHSFFFLKWAILWCHLLVSYQSFKLCPLQNPLSSIGQDHHNGQCGHIASVLPLLSQCSISKIHARPWSCQSYISWQPCRLYHV